MAFDAGTIIARMDLDDADFDRKLREDVRRIEEFEKRDHEIKITPEVDKAGAARVRHDIEQIDRQVTADAHRRGGLLSMLTKMFSSSGTGGPGGASGTAAFHRNLLAAAGPGIAGIGAKGATIASAIPLGLAALPALAAPLLAGGVGLGGVGVAGILGMQAAKPATALLGAQSQAQQALAAASTPAQRTAALAQLKQINQQVSQLSPALQSVFHSLSGFEKWWQGFTKSLAPAIVGPVRVITSTLEHLGPVIRQVFAGAMTLIVPFIRGLGDVVRMIGPGLSQAFRAAAPLMRPFLDGLGQLIKGLLPGLVALLRAAHPAVVVFAQILGTLGRDLGGMLRDFAPVLRQSSVILKALLDVVSALFPIIGRLAAVFARALAPVFVTFAGVIKSLLPFLVTLGRILASFAAAVIKDLAAALGAVAVLLRDLAPSFRILASALGRVFTIMENAGVFQTLANALYQVAPVLAKLINDLMRQLAPDLPVIIRLVSQLATILVDLLAAGLDAVLQGVDYLVRHFGGLIKWLGLAALAEYAFGAAMAFVAANPVVAIIAGIVLLIGAIVLLVKHWGRAWSDIKNWARDAWNFLTHGWGQYLIPELYAIRKVVEFVRDHWGAAWGVMKQAGQDFWHWIWDDFGAKIKDFLVNTLPHWWDLAVQGVKAAWHALQNVVLAPVRFVIDHVIDGLIGAFDRISDVVHGPHISPIHPFGLQAGGRIPGYGGGDRHLALLESGETVVPKEHAGDTGFAAWARAVGIRGYQHGGPVGQNPPGRFPGVDQPQPGSEPFGGGVARDLSGFFKGVYSFGRMANAVLTGNQKALANGLKAFLGHTGFGGAGGGMLKMLSGAAESIVQHAVKFLIGNFGATGSGKDIVSYAMRWIGRIPYVWGGTAVPGGADCSGFVEAIYKHFGISAPRTSEAQGAWVKRGPPTAGGLAFYHSPPGGPDPGHVAIVRNATQVISQGGGMGPQLMGLHGMPLLWTGTPPGGFSTYGPHSGRWNLPGLESLWDRAGGPPSRAHVAGAIALAESGGDPRIVNSIGAAGLWQIYGKPFPGNALDPMTNARMAVFKYHAANGFSPWVTYMTGAYRHFMDSGGWLEPGANFSVNKTGRREAVLNPAQSDAFVSLAAALHESARSARGGGSSLEAKLDRLIRAVERSAGQTGQAVGDALNGAARSASYRASYSVR